MYKPKFDSYTTLLAHLNGSNGSTIFVDETGKTITRGGEASLDKDIYKFGGASLKLNGSTDYLSLADSNDFDFGNGNFTIDFWLNLNGFSGTFATGLFSQRTTFSTNLAFYFYISQSDKRLYFYHTTDGSTTIGGGFNTVFNTATWYHLELVRNGTEIYLFVNGVKESNVLSVGTNTFYNSNANVTIGCMKTGASTYSHFTNGYIDEFRVSKGIARHTSNFTPPTVEYYGG